MAGNSGGGGGPLPLFQDSQDCGSGWSSFSCVVIKSFLVKSQPQARLLLGGVPALWSGAEGRPPRSEPTQGPGICICPSACDFYPGWELVTTP